MSGVVTRISLPVGATPHTLQRLLTVSGKPIFAFVSSTPLYKTLSVSLSSGSQVANVMALQRALKARGYYTGSVSGAFDTSTQTAVEAWQADEGVGQTGQITTTQFVWVPKGRMIYSWSVALGNQVSSGTALATVGAPRDLIAQALVSQADIASLKVGQKATLTIDGDTSNPFTGTISFIDSQPASSGSSGGTSSGTVEYTVDFVPHHLPSLARSGMTGTLVIILAQRTNVLIVPTRAVSGTSSVPLVRVMVNGKPAYRQVQTGMATSTYTQITSGIAAGEVVVTGEYSNAATTTSGSSGLGGLSGFPGAGTFRRASGTSGGSGAFPAPPGQ
ncbi:MAG: HlyD family efflux transporter periplasmic adaptor subunit [Actinomycetes bacterium]